MRLPDGRLIARHIELSSGGGGDSSQNTNTNQNSNSNENQNQNQNQNDNHNDNSNHNGDDSHSDSNSNQNSHDDHGGNGNGKVGEKITFKVTNQGTIAHTFVVRNADGSQVLAKTTIQPGQTTTLDFTPSAAGQYLIDCDVAGHKAAGMIGSLTVN